MYDVMLLCLCACHSMCAHLVIGDLLQVKVGGIDYLHAGVAVVHAAESAPLFGVWIEPVGLLSAALQGEDRQVEVSDEAPVRPPLLRPSLGASLATF